MIVANNGKTQRDEARARYRPDNIKLLLIAEAPPAALDRFFYFENVKDHDHLYIETMNALYCQKPYNVGHLRRNKKSYLERFRTDGFFMIDAVEDPIDQAVSNRNSESIIIERRQDLFDRLEKLKVRDAKIILVKASVYHSLFGPMKNLGYNIINEGVVPFPSTGQQERYRTMFRKLVADNMGK